MPAPISDAARDVVAERVRQQHAERWTPAHDDAHASGELAAAAAAYALYSTDRPTPMQMALAVWPFEFRWFKPFARRRPYWDAASQRRMLVKAGALILAEIERRDRAAARPHATPTAAVEA